MAVITISRQEGAGGEEIASRVAGRLGFTLIDRTRIQQLLEEEGIDEIDLEILEERPPGLIESLDEHRQIYRDFIQSYIVDLSEDDDLVILGCGGQFIFRTIPNTLHIKILASWDQRIERLCQARGVSPRVAARILRKSDRERAHYLRYLYDDDGTDPLSYDLLIRTDRINLHDAVELIVQSVELLGLRSNRKSLPSRPESLAPIEHPATEKPFANEAEVEFARVLDFYKIRWVHEPRTFPLEWDGQGNVTEAFTPDFYMPDQNLYIELTTLKQNLVTKKNRKLRRLKALYPDVNIKLFYKKDYQKLLEKYGLATPGEESL